jgi:hypothetical protein
MITPSHLHEKPQYPLPAEYVSVPKQYTWEYNLGDMIVLDILDLTTEFFTRWHALIKSDPNVESFKPDERLIVRQVLDAIRQESDAEIDLATMVFHDIATLDPFHEDFEGNVVQYDQVNAQLSNLTVSFGKALISRLKSTGIYTHGYLPYQFCGWLGDTAVLSLDAQHGGTVPIPKTPEHVNYLYTPPGHCRIDQGSY